METWMRPYTKYRKAKTKDTKCSECGFYNKPFQNHGLGRCCGRTAVGKNHTCDAAYIEQK